MVTEYVIQFSDDGELWRTYSDSNAQDQVDLRLTIQIDNETLIKTNKFI